jgi:hypothetical protein
MKEQKQVIHLMAEEVKERDKYFDRLLREHAHEIAQTHNYEIRTPAANELLIDIDSETDFAVLKAHLDTFHTYVARVNGVTLTPSKSGAEGKWHAVVVLERAIGDETRVLYQAVLGSDRKRELLSIARIRCGIDDPILFFEKKEETP